jgi:molybdenum cofactor biosynthesis enzyme MoaA
MKAIHKIQHIFREEGAAGLARRVTREVGLPNLGAKPRGMTCLKPFYYVSIHLDGRVYCCCPGWLRFPLGRLSATTTIADLWNNRRARAFRGAMFSGRLGRVCREEVCPYILDESLPALIAGDVAKSIAATTAFPEDVQSDRQVMSALQNHRRRLAYLPKSVEIAADARCNLVCPSCREAKITQISAKNAALLELIAKNIEMIGPNLRHLHLLGSGEALFSPFTRDLLKNLQPERYPDLSIHLLTNGQLLTPKVWEQLRPGTELVREISVSVDAATKGTYEQVRRPGKWVRLLENLAFLRQLRKEGPVRKTSLNFVVSARNFREMPAFVRLGEQFDVDRVVFTTIQPWSGMGMAWRQAAVHRPDHLLHPEFERVLKAPELQSPKVVMGVEGQG